MQDFERDVMKQCGIPENGEVHLLSGTQKGCSKCGRILCADKFSIHSKRPDGLQVYCKECMSDMNRKRNKEKSLVTANSKAKPEQLKRCRMHKEDELVRPAAQIPPHPVIMENISDQELVDTLV